ncbi:MAG TPA: hypothetical protein IGR64_08860, partial [Leptolyngbyaceae cyanobacterium M65_K2018_010]|nr:hypothetical protein [Leptolyngbyaceae cyanobacterium M65_K2018_010]
MPSADLVDELLSTLQVYGQTYGWPTAVDQRRALVSTLLRLTLGAKNAPLSLRESAQILDQVMAQFDFSSRGGAIASQAQQILINQAHQWQADLQQKVTDTLVAYVQSQAPGLDPTTLRDLALRVIPIVADRDITPAEVKGLVGQVVDAFDLEAALGQRVNPAVVGAVKALVTSLSQKSLETAVSETVTAYVIQFAPTLKEIG